MPKSASIKRFWPLLCKSFPILAALADVEGQVVVDVGLADVVVATGEVSDIFPANKMAENENF